MFPDKKFCICERCGNLVEMIQNSGVPVMCCGQAMTEVVAGAVEASQEKHIPVAFYDEKTVTVTVGSVAHPMTEEHSILWVYLQTDKGCQRKNMTVGEAPVVTFALANEKPVAVYAYCNLHGLWKADVEEPKVCDLQPLDTASKENYIVCKCNNVRYFDILDEIHAHTNINDLMEAFEAVKNTTHCSTGCGGCYEKVLAIISEAMSNK